MHLLFEWYHPLVQWVKVLCQLRSNSLQPWYSSCQKSLNNAVLRHLVHYTWTKPRVTINNLLLRGLAMWAKHKSLHAQISAKISNYNNYCNIVSTHIQTNLYIIFLQSFVVRRCFCDFATERGREKKKWLTDLALKYSVQGTGQYVSKF